MLLLLLLFNRININDSDLQLMQETLGGYHNLHMLFASTVNLSIWTIECAKPYHVEKL